MLRWAQVGLSSVRGHAISELSLAMNVGRFGAEEANRRTTPDPWDDLQVPKGLDVSIITQEVISAMRAGDGDPFGGNRLPDLEVVERYQHLTPAVRTAQVLNPQIATEGSNNWVMSGDRSPTGVPILANDPHRRIEMPALRYFVHLNAPGWNVIGGGEPPVVGVDAGNNERMAWGFTFAGTDMVDLYVEEVDPENPNLVRWQDGWEQLRVIEEEIEIKGEAPRTVALKFSRHGPVIYEDTENHVAYAVRSVVQDPGTAAYKGSFKMAQAESCNDFFERAMYWMVPTHSLICGDVEGNIALQVTGLTPDRDGWNGRLPVPGTGEYEWLGFRSDLPREFNPARGYITTANNNVHPPGYEGRPVFYHSSRGVETSRITASPSDPRDGPVVLSRGSPGDPARRLLVGVRSGHSRFPGVDLQPPGSGARTCLDCRVGWSVHEGEHRRGNLRAVGPAVRFESTECRHAESGAPGADRGGLEADRCRVDGRLGSRLVRVAVRQK